MRHDEIIIDSRGSYHVEMSNDLKEALRKQFDYWDKQVLRSTRILMSEEDYKDILKWQNGL